MALIIKVQRPPSGLQERIAQVQMMDKIIKANTCIICGRLERHPTKEVRPIQ